MVSRKIKKKLMTLLNLYLEMFLENIQRINFLLQKNLNEKILKDFEDKKIVPTGLLPGRQAFRSMHEARTIEEKYDDTYIQEKGYRRDAIVYPKDISVNYNKQTSKCKVKFSLPKGSYATVLIENIANRNLKS